MCGITSLADALAAIDAGADTLGFVFYEPSPRFITPIDAGAIIAALPSEVVCVGLFVNHTADQIKAAVVASGVLIMQFHGTEPTALCEQLQSELGLPYWKVIHIPAATPALPNAMTATDSEDARNALLVKSCQLYSSAQALLFDTASPAWGGTGQTFEWSNLLPLSQTAHNQQDLRVPPLVLSGGLHAQNVGAGINLLRPWAVDVSSGIERISADGKPQKGVKDSRAMRNFVAAVRLADKSINTHSTN